MQTQHTSSRRRRRLRALMLPCFVLGVLSILGLHYLLFGLRRSDWMRWLRIVQESPIGAAPSEIERDFNQRFIPSVAARTLLQGVDARAIRAMSSERVTARDGMVFVREDMDVCSTVPFLSRADRRPREAINALAALSKRLNQRGIRFVVVVVPSKASICVEHLYADYDSGLGPDLNAGHQPWMDALQAAGVEAFDPSSLLWANRSEGMYFDLDTHWTPRAMRVTAAALAERLRSTLADVPTHQLTSRVAHRTITGDLAESGSLAAGLITFDFEQILDGSDLARFGDDAPTLVVGDSNVGLLQDQSGGFAHLLALELRQPVQSDGIWGVRAGPMIRAAEENERSLANKKVVVLVFAMRKLLTEEWDHISP